MPHLATLQPVLAVWASVADRSLLDLSGVEAPRNASADYTFGLFASGASAQAEAFAFRAALNAAMAAFGEYYKVAVAVLRGDAAAAPPPSKAGAQLLRLDYDACACAAVAAAGCDDESVRGSGEHRFSRLRAPADFKSDFAALRRAFDTAGVATKQDWVDPWQRLKWELFRQSTLNSLLIHQSCGFNKLVESYES
ncbi:hypothetical protein M885DRAFT_211187 [Pelagophyceae sp. CCMP2097]|nr:hypothetical protein M885DRAFT_211187 [Pelagophyceae sp. CCMP2097]